VDRRDVLFDHARYLAAMSERTMHQTTIPFDHALWRGMRAAAARQQMSIAQYVRYAVLIQLERNAQPLRSTRHDDFDSAPT
jgi:hypothetical protein